MTDIYAPEPEPLISQIVPYYITTDEIDPDVSWIRGELVLRINCADGVVIVVIEKRN